MKAWVIVLILAGLYIVFIAAPAVVMTVVTFSRRDIKKNKNNRLEDSCYLPYEKLMKEGLIHFRHSTREEISADAFDGVRLAADYYPADSRTTVILMHGYNTSPIANYCVIGADLHKMGMNVLMPYERGHLKSGGKHSTLSMLERKDVVTWVQWAREHGAEQIVLYGISMGAASVAYALENLPADTVKRAVVDCGFVSPYEAMRRESDKRRLPSGMLMPYSVLISRLLFHTDIRYRTTESLSGTEIPVLFLYGDADTTVDVKEGRSMYEACASEKVFLEVRGAEHTVAYLAASPEQKEQFRKFINICREDGGTGENHG